MVVLTELAGASGPVVHDVAVVEHPGRSITAISLPWPRSSGSCSLTLAVAQDMTESADVAVVEHPAGASPW